MIGIFDSGTGGLTVAKEIFKALPYYQIIYFGDTARLPYGTKGAGFVKKYSAKITKWLLNKGAKVIVVACHTSSSQAGDFLKQNFKNTPIFEMISPCAKEVCRYKKIGIAGTTGTVKSKAWEKHILKANPASKIQSVACPLFVPLAEEGWTGNKIARETAKEYLKKFSNIDALVLACTHYPMLKKTIWQTIGKDVKIIDPAKMLAKELAMFLKDNRQIDLSLKKGKNNKFFFSDEPYNLDKISKLCLKQKIEPIISDPF